MKIQIIGAVVLCIVLSALYLLTSPTTDTPHEAAPAASSQSSNDAAFSNLKIQ